MKVSKSKFAQLFILGLIILSGCKNSVTLPSATTTIGSNGSAVPAPEQLCSSVTGGQVVLGVTGVGVCQGASGGANATAADVLAGTYFWDSTGTSVLGTMVGGGGGSSFGDLTGSNMNRNVATAQITLSVEKSTTTGYPAGYREVMDASKDDEGYYDASQGCTGAPGDLCTTVVKAVRPVSPCGVGAGLDTVTARISDCFTQNPLTSIWTGETKGINGEATWKLVTLVGTKEVWRDERTGLLWGDTIASDTNCRASGNSQTAAQDGSASGYCDPANVGGYQDATPTSYCSESGSLLPAKAGENWATGVYDNAKGGMGAIGLVGTRPSVRWRLPTKNDWMQAEIDGIKFVLPNMADTFWSATVFSGSRDGAWFFDGNYGNFSNVVSRSYNYSVRCLGR